jgi:excinuclease ABC subunit C
MNQPFNENKGYFLPTEVLSIPENPGVYLMKDKDGKVIYVGKAKNLKKRVSSYFTQKADEFTKTRFLVDHIALIDTISVSNESEALILEANLIKEFMPKYNVNFKDNKFYPFVKVTIKEDFPRIVFSREQKRDGALYFGPFTSARSVRQYIDIVQRLFLIRTCVEMPKKECLNYHIKRCSGPCIHRISREDYAVQLKGAIKLLTGNLDKLVLEFEKEMQEASKNLLFEKAQIFKEKMRSVQFFQESQSVFLPENINADFIGCFSKWGKAVFVVSILRGGRMVGKRSFSATLSMQEELLEIFPNFIIQYAEKSDKKEDWIVISEDFSSVTSSVNAYFQKMQWQIQLSTPRNNRQKALIDMANENASLHLSQLLSKVETSESLNLLQKVLNLDTLPMRIEGFDIANILGENSVASLVSFYAGKPDKANYRHFKMKSKSTQDDFAMIYEAVYRRYKRLKEENQDFPDLILVDGGKGQLNSALEALSSLNLTLNVVSLAKKNEEIYQPYDSKPLILPKNSPALHILQQVRDETHRFANSFYNKLKRKNLTASLLDDISGIGEKRKQKIVEKILKYDIIKSLKVEDLIQEGIPEKTARIVLEKLKQNID